MEGAPSSVDRYGVMGDPVSHSRSPVIHRLFALQTNQDLQYELLPEAMIVPLTRGVSAVWYWLTG